MNQNGIRFLAVVATVAIALSGCLTTGGAKVVEDPQKRFTYRALADMRPQVTDGTYDHYTVASPAMEIYVVAVEAPSEQVGQELAFDRVGRDFASLKIDGSPSMGEWRANKFTTATEGEWAGILYQYRGGTSYCMIVYGGGRLVAGRSAGAGHHDHRKLPVRPGRRRGVSPCQFRGTRELHR